MLYSCFSFFDYFLGTHGIACVAKVFEVHNHVFCGSVNKCTQKTIKLYFMRQKISISSQSINEGK